HLWDIDLDDDLTLEVPAGIQIQVGVGVAGEAVNARVLATPERVDRPIERQVVARHLVEGGLGSDLVEIDAERLGRVEGPDSLGGQPGQAPPLLPLDLLSIPAHRLSSLAPSGSRVERMFAYGKAVASPFERRCRDFCEDPGSCRRAAHSFTPPSTAPTGSSMPRVGTWPTAGAGWLPRSRASRSPRRSRKAPAGPDARSGRACPPPRNTACAAGRWHRAWGPASPTCAPPSPIAAGTPGWWSGSR